MVLICTAMGGLHAQVRPPVFSENFNQLSAGIPAGWNNDSIVSSSLAQYKWKYDRNGVDNTGCMYYTKVGSEYTENLLVTPAINVSAGEFMLAFDCKLVGGKGRLYVHLSYDGGKTFDQTPFISIDGIDNNIVWSHEIKKLPTSPTGTVAVAFKAVGISTGGLTPQIYLDNVVVDYIPRCASPINFMVSGVSATSVTLGWGYSDMGEYGRRADVVVMKDGVIVKEETFNLTAPGTIVVTGLEADTEYTAKVRMNCEEAYMGRSLWSNTITFRTPCSPKKPQILYTFDDDVQVSECWLVNRTSTDLAAVMPSSLVKYGAIGKSLEIPKGLKGMGDTYVFTDGIDHEANALEISLVAYNNNQSNDEIIEIGIQGDIYAPSTYCPLREVTLKPKIWTRVVVYTDQVPLGAAKGASLVLWTKNLEKASIFVDNIEINAMSGCKVPANVSVTQIYTDGARFAWDGQSGAALAVYNVNGEEETLLGKVTDENQKLALQENTLYRLKFKSSCGENLSSWSEDEIIFKTPCEPILPPYVADFEDNKIPDCWNNVGFTTIDNKFFEWGTTKISTVNDIKNISPEAEYGQYVLSSPLGQVGVNQPKVNLIMPYMTIPVANKYMVEFYMYRNNRAGSAKDFVNIYANDKPTTEGATRIGRISSKSTLEPATMVTGWERYECLIPMQGNVYIIFENEMANGAISYIDNVAVRTATSCMAPTGILVEDVDDTNATIKWTSRCDADEYLLSYTTTGGGKITEKNISVKNSSEYTITGLTANTNYGYMDVELRAVCGVGDTSATAKDRLQLKTVCGPMDLPYTRSTADWNCFTVLEKEGSYPSSSGVNINMRGKVNVFALPEMKYETAQGHRISFEYISSDGGELSVGTTSELENWRDMKIVATIKGTTERVSHIVKFTEESGKYIVLLYQSEKNTYNSMIYNLKVDEIPPCPDVTGATVSELGFDNAKINVTTLDEVSKFDVEYGKTDGFVAGEGTLIENVDNGFTLPQLEAFTGYSFRVRTNCGGDDRGTWSAVQKFTTLCTPFDLSAGTFSDSFEDNGLGCWMTQGEKQWTQAQTVANVHTGKKYLQFGGIYNKIVTSDLYRSVDLKAGQRYEFSCYVRLSAASAEGYYMSVGYCSGVGVSEENVVNFIDRQPVTTNQYVKVSGLFTPNADMTYIRLRGETSSSSPYFYLDDVTIMPVSNLYPVNIMLEELTDSKAVIVWQPQPVNHYNVKVSTSQLADPETGEGDVFDSQVAAQTATLELTGLLANKEYYVYMQSVYAGDAKSRWTDVFRFKTTCGAVEGDFVENFEEANALECWRWNELNTILRVTNQKHEGMASCSLGASTTITTPALISSGTLDGKVLRMFVKAAAGSANVSIGVAKVTSSPIDYYRTSTVAVPSNAWTEVVCYFNGIGQNDEWKDARYIAIATDAACFIDAVSVTDVASCARPTNVTVSEIEAEYAILDWQMYEEKPCLVTVKQDNEVVKSVTAQQHPFRIDGLYGNTAYEVEISTQCGSDEHSTPWTISFKTNCGDVRLPYIENFDGVAFGKIPDCWTDTAKVGQVLASANKWTAANNIIPGMVMSFNSTAGNSKGNGSRMQTPVIDLTGVDDASLFFFTRSTNEYATFDVMVSTDGGNTFPDTIARDMAYTRWSNVQCNLKKYCGRKISIGFFAASIATTNAYIYIDDVRVTEPRECDATATIAVTGVDGSTANVTVTDEMGSAWEVAVGKSGFDPDEAQVQTLTEKESIVTNVPVATVCDMYVRVKCKDGGHSAWSQPVKFTSGCAALPLPYSTDFENATAVTDLVCYRAGVGTMGELVAIQKTGGIAGVSLKFNNTTRTGYLILPEMDGDIENLIIKFKYQYDGAQVAPFQIGLVHKDEIGNCTERFVPAAEVRRSVQTADVAYSFATAGLGGRDYRIVFRVPQMTASDKLLIDDLEVRDAAQSTVPLNIRVADVKDVSAMVSWTTFGNIDHAEISLNGEENLITVAGGVNAHQLTGLTANTGYTVRVRGVDARGQVTEWSSAVKFSTNNTPAELPYICGFESSELALTRLWQFPQRGDRQYWAISGRHTEGVYSGEKALYVAYGIDTVHVYTEPKFSSQLAAPQNADAALTLNLEKGTYRLSFKYHSGASGDGYDYLRVVLLPRNGGAGVLSSAQMELSGQIANVNTWQPFDKEFFVAESGFYQLAFLWTSRVSDHFNEHTYSPAAIDDIDLHRVVCPPVLTVTCDSVSDSAAKLLWQDNIPDGTAYQYVLVKGDEPFNEAAPVDVTAGQRFVKVIGLTPDTQYRFKVRAKCTADNTSEWTAEYLFSTSCVADVADNNVIYSDGFETYEGTDLSCWKHSGTYTGRWAEGSAVNTGIEAAEGSKCVAIAANAKAQINRKLQLKAGLNYQLQFKAAQSDETFNDTRVRVFLGEEFVNVATATVLYDAQVTTTAYVQHTARFNVGKDGVYQIGIYGMTGGVTRYLTLDDVRLTTVDCDMPSMLTATDVTATKAKITWSGTADRYKVSLLRGGILQKEEEVTGTIKEYNDLFGMSKYTVEVRTICNDGSESGVASVDFSTTCGGAAPTPYFEAFTIKPDCWTMKANTAAKWAYRQEANGNGVMWFDSKNGGAGARATLVSPAVMIDAKGYNMTLDYINPAGGPLNVMFSVDGGETCADTVINNATGIGSWTTVSVNLDKYEGKSVTVVAEGISNYSLNSGAYIYIDNLRVNKATEIKDINDTVCYGSAYMENGFEISAVRHYGEKLYQRVAVAEKAGDTDTLYNLSLYVPDNDYYVVDIFISGVPYSGFGFENITRPGSDYTRTEVSTLGCDSTIHLTLMEMEVDVIVYDTVCGGETYTFCGEKLTESCIRTCTEKNAYGIDSTTTLHLTVLPALVEREITICEGDFVEFDGRKLMETGVYEADSTYLTTKGCTYTSRLALTVVAAETTIDTTICQGRYVEIEGRRYDKQGEYRIVLTPENGCPRAVKLNLTVSESDKVTYHTDACENKPIYYPGFAGEIVEKDTTLQNVSKTAAGCDSITILVVKYHETVETYDTVYCTENVYTCENGETLLASGTCDSHGLTANGCDSIHHRYVHFTTGIQNIRLQEMIISPNPVKVSMPAFADGEWTNDMMKGMTVEVMDVTGRSIYKRDVTERPIRIDGLGESGVYVIRIVDGNGKSYMGKLIVE